MATKEELYAELDAEHAANLAAFKLTLPAVIRCTQPSCVTVGGAVIEPTPARIELWEWQKRKYDAVTPSYVCDACKARITASVQAAIDATPKQLVEFSDASESWVQDMNEVAKLLYPIG